MTYLKAFLLIGAISLTCIPRSTHAQTAGYRRIQNTVTKDSADKIKTRIKSIPNDLFEAYSYIANEDTIPYRLLRPLKTLSKARYPLVLVLHSSGTPIGTDNVSQLGVLAKLWAQQDIRENFPAFIVAPQFPRRSSNYIPDATRKALVSKPDPALSTVLQLIDSLKNALPIDTRKIYAIGFSMGASTSINALDLRPGMFAAALSISGIPSMGNIPTLSNTAIWLVHGTADTENPMAGDSLLYKELRAHGSRNIQFWQIDGLEHEIYPALYMGTAIPEWLFSKRKDSRSARSAN